MDTRPIIGITMGDPAGIGPEIVVKSLGETEVYEICRPIIIGNTAVITQAVGIAGRPDLEVNRVQEVKDGKFTYGTIDVLEATDLDIEKLEHRKVDAEAGRAAGDCIKKVIELALEGKVDATVTGPIQKDSLNQGGYHYAGHTEFYADHTKTSEYAMMLSHGSFRVIHVTTHVPLRAVPDLIVKDRVLNTIILAENAVKSLGIEHPKIGVAGLNPHSSDDGMFGDEEEKEIRPAVVAARKMGIDVEGPVPPDSIFSKARGGTYDIAVAMYHDQGHIPMKVVGFVWDEESKKWSSISGINTTIGLPIIRTSVDHGVAFGKAGKGQADHKSMMESIIQAVKQARSSFGK